jgi:hypothetical protein
MDSLLAAIDADNTGMIRHCSREVLQRALEHLVYSEVALSGDSSAMSDLLVAAADLDRGPRKP